MLERCAKCAEDWVTHSRLWPPSHLTVKSHFLGSQKIIRISWLFNCKYTNCIVHLYWWNSVHYLCHAFLLDPNWELYLFLPLIVSSMLGNSFSFQCLSCVKYAIVLRLMSAIPFRPILLFFAAKDQLWCSHRWSSVVDRIVQHFLGLWARTVVGHACARHW